MLQKNGRFQLFIFVVGCLLFCVTRLYRIDLFPIYFFCDEAFIGNEARVLLKRHMFDHQGRFFPLFYEKAANRWVPQLSVYLSLPVEYFWPRSVIALRSLTVVISLFSAATICFACKKIRPESPAWWLPVLFLTVTPVWFLHSRTAFENALAVAFYGVGIAGYLLYRVCNPRYVWLAIFGMAMLMYSHLSGTTIALSTCLILAVVDLPYHWRNRASLIFPAVVAVACLIPLISFCVTRPDAMGGQLSVLGSGWTKNGQAWTAAMESLSRVSQALDPRFLWSEGFTDETRHIWSGRPMFSYWSAPLVALGFLSALVTIRKPESRVLLICVLTSVFPVLWVQSHTMRIFYIISPLAFLATGGARIIFTLAARPLFQVALSVVALVAVSYQSFAMTREAIMEAPRWFKDYGLYGLQWGALKVYGQAIPDFLREHPTESLVQSGSWANGIETFPEYFLTEPERQRLQTLYFDIFCPPPEIEKVPAGLTFLLSESDRIQVERSGLFKPIVPTLEIPFPDGRVGFTFAKLEYVDNVAELLMPERQRRVALVDAKVSVLGVPATVTTSRLDIGQASDIFDGTLNTLARGMAANPFILKVKFSTPVKIRDVSAMFGTTAMDWKASANLAGKQVATASGASPEPLVTDPWLTLSLGVAPVELDELHFELHQRDALPDRAHIHVFEVELK